MIVLQFVKGADFGADMILWFSHGGWSHVDTVVREGLLGARSDHVGGAPPGVQIRDPSYVGDLPVLRMQLECAPEVGAAYEAFVRSQIGKPYDVEGIKGFISGRDWRDDSAWFCSELAAAGLEHARYFGHPLATPTNKMTPADLLLALSVNNPVPEIAPTRLIALTSAPILNGAE